MAPRGGVSLGNWEPLEGGPAARAGLGGRSIAGRHGLSQATELAALIVPPSFMCTRPAEALSSQPGPIQCHDRYPFQLMRTPIDSIFGRIQDRFRMNAVDSGPGDVPDVMSQTALRTPPFA